MEGGEFGGLGKIGGGYEGRLVLRGVESKKFVRVRFDFLRRVLVRLRASVIRFALDFVARAAGRCMRGWGGMQLEVGDFGGHVLIIIIGYLLDSKEG